MKNLHFSEYFKNFLFDENHLHVFNYQKLDKLSDKEIILIIDGKKVIIEGNNLKIKQMTKQELLINGQILKVEFEYER